MRPSALSAIALLYLTACAGVETSAWDPATACGPKVRPLSVRLIDARSEFATGGARAAVARAEQSVGPVELLDWNVHRSTDYAHLKDQGAQRGCDVVIYVEKQDNLEGGWSGHHVFLARRADNPVE